MTSPKKPATNDSNPAPSLRLLKSLGCIGTAGLLGSSSLLSNVALAQGARKEPAVIGEVAALLNGSNPGSGIGAELFTAAVSPAASNAADSKADDSKAAAADPRMPTASGEASEIAMADLDPAPAEAAPEPYIEPAAETSGVEEVYAEPYVAPQPAAQEPAPYSAEPEPVLPAPQLEAPVVNLTPADLAPPTSDSFGAAGSGAVIDSSDLYSTGATGGTEQLVEQPAVVVTERGSEAVIAAPTDANTPANGLNSGAVTAGAAKRPSGTLANQQNPANLQDGQRNGDRPTVLINPPRNASLPAPNAAPTTRVAGNTASDSGYSITYPSQAQNPLQMMVQGFGRSLSQSVDAASYYARTQRPSALPGNGDRRLLFPLSVPSPISSVFGWRVHPIFQTWRFHSGTDFAADQGVPVVAALSGRINTADFVGGYGLTVVLDHVGGQSQTLYGHMSELFVRPGQVVRQGEVIGRVGSTGNSTGPHLHFEVRQRDAAGNWVAIAPESHLEGSVAQLMNALRGQPFQLGQLSPIPLAQDPFKIKPSNLTGLSTGLLPLLQSAPSTQPPGQPTQNAVAATPLERAVVQVVRSLKTQPSATSRRTQPVARRQPAMNPALSPAANPETGSNTVSQFSAPGNDGSFPSPLPQVPQPRQLAQVETQR